MSHQIRQGVKQTLSTMLLTVPGIPSVFTYKSKSPQTVDPYVEIYLGKSSESRLSQSAPIGKKEIDLTAQLLIFSRDIYNDGTGQMNFDDLLDAIDTTLRQNIAPNTALTGGTILAIGWEQINTTVFPPTLDGQILKLAALKQFDVRVQVVG